MSERVERVERVDLRMVGHAVLLAIGRGADVLVSVDLRVGVELGSC